jgi:predicted nucleic acid-binding protein
MLEPAAGPFLFDTSAESWFRQTPEIVYQEWLRQYLLRHPLNVSAITVAERIRGYSRVWQNAAEDRRAEIDRRRLDYLQSIGRVWPLDMRAAITAGEIMALLPNAPTPPKRTHQLAESRADRVARWRFDCMIAATALIAGLPLIHNNAADFEAIRSAVEISPGRFPKIGPLQLVRCVSVV